MKRKIYKAGLLAVLITCSVQLAKAQNQVYWREGFQPESGCDLTTTNPAAPVSYYFNGSAGVWYGVNLYRTTGTGCASPYGANHVRYRNIAGGDSGYLVTPIVDYGIQEFHFAISRANRYFTVWRTDDTLATTTNWTLVVGNHHKNVTCSDTTIVVASATARRLKIVGRPLTDSDVDSFWVTSFSALPVPLSLLSFNASYDGKKVNMNWATSNEVNVRNFSIERSSDARQFASIGTVNANNFAGNNNYSFTDALPLSGVSFYRLKINDNDGRYKYSAVVSVNSKIGSGISIYPNPASASVSVAHGKLGNGAYLKIYTPDGKLVFTEKIADGALQTAMAITKLLPGSYIIHAVSDTQKKIINFIKQ